MRDLVDETRSHFGKSDGIRRSLFDLLKDDANEIERLREQLECAEKALNFHDPYHIGSYWAKWKESASSVSPQSDEQR